MTGSPSRIEFKTRSLSNEIVDALTNAAVLDGARLDWDEGPSTAEDIGFRLRRARNASIPNDVVTLVSDHSPGNQFGTLELALNKAGVAWYRIAADTKPQAVAVRKSAPIP